MLPSAPTSSFPYRVLAQVGEGAMGQVYRAEDIELGRQVAIKVIKPSFLASLSEREAQDAMQRFLQEARAAAALSHPGVTVVHRVGSEGGWPYIAMEWLDGSTLEQVIAHNKRLSVEQATRVGLQVLAVLDAAHRAGIVHRDIKPGNLILTTDRRIKVTDFGVARVQGSSLMHTQAGFVLGTPQYSAPEQLAGKAVDCRADLYSVGAVLYEAVTGRPPFDADSLYELVGLVQTATPAPASARAPGISPSFDAFLQRALEKLPDQRFSSATEMARALQSFLARNTASAVAATVARASSSAPTPPSVPTAVAEGESAAALIAGTVRRWPATALGRQDLSRLLDRILEKPLHTNAFCGALDVAGAVFLICDGVVFSVFNPSTGAFGDLVIESLPAEIEATLLSCPQELEPRVVTLLASLLAPARPRLSGLEAAFVDVPQLGAKLGAEGFDGAIRFARGAQLGFALFSRGKRVLDLFAGSWRHDARTTRWEQWIASAGAQVSVEDRQSLFPSLTYRRQLRGLSLEVVRETQPAGSAIRSDARADAAALQLRPSVAPTAALPTDSTLQALLAADPAVELARWLLVDVELQFQQFQRTKRWRGLLEPVASIKTVKLHHEIPAGAARAARFDAVTLSSTGRVLHVLDRIASGTREAVTAFLDRVVEAKAAAGDGLDAAILVAPSFTEDALDAYLGALRASKRASFRSALELLSHREGFLTIGRSGCHILLVEETDGRRRPLVPQD